MTSDKQGAGPSIYAGVNINNEFIAFWQSGENALSFFTPKDFYENYPIKDTCEWKTIRDGYDERGVGEPFSQYDDIVNAAWHYLGFRNVLNRASVAVSTMQPGRYYRRIWRGWFKVDGFDSYNPIRPSAYGQQYTRSIVASSSLFDYLVDIFRHVEPDQENLGAFGHKIRELLILTCTEIEAGWRAVLDNNVREPKSSYTTRDYVRVKEPLRLEEWSVSLKDYPNLQAFRPFEGWREDCPTKSLGWYDAYNDVKHHRDAKFAKASLRNLLSAMAALHVVQAAQWGPETYSILHGNRFSPFDVVKTPIYKPSELYIPSIDGKATAEFALYFDR